jgi:Cupin superfamily protein
VSCVKDLLGQDIDFSSPRRGLIHQHGAQDRFAQVLSWPGLNELLRSQALTFPRLTLRRRAQALPVSSYTTLIRAPGGDFPQLDVAAVMRHLRAGATLTINLIDRMAPGVRGIREALERELRIPVVAHLYASWGTTPGFSFHWDPHDVIAVQLHGQKEWLLHEQTRQWPVPGDAGIAPEAPGTKLILAQGDALYVPRGWWHEVVATNQPSVHLAIMLMRPNGADFLTWVARRAAAVELVRRDLPSPGAATDEYVELLRRAVTELISGESLDQYWGEEDRGSQLDPLPSLETLRAEPFEAVPADARLALLSTRPVLDSTAEGLSVAIGEHTWHFPAAAGQLLRTLAAGGTVELAALLRAVPAQQVAGMIDAGHLAVI